MRRANYFLVPVYGNRRYWSLKKLATSVCYLKFIPVPSMHCVFSVVLSSYKLGRLFFLLHILQTAEFSEEVTNEH